MRFTLTILREHYQQLTEVLLRPDGNEWAALLRCGSSQQVDPWTGVAEQRLLCRAMVPLSPKDVHQTSPGKITYSTTPYYNLIKEASEARERVVVVHSHPTGVAAFSPDDDTSDRELLEILQQRTCDSEPLCSLVMDGSGFMRGRVWESSLHHEPLDLIRIVGGRVQLLWNQDRSPTPDQRFDRQDLAFGAEFTARLRGLRVGIVGCGGTGSAVALLLARLGVGHLVLIDPDLVEFTNLNRLHFSRQADAALGVPKALTVARAISELGLGINVRHACAYVDSVESRDLLRSCDLILGCTDDNLGRNLLNRLAYFYLIPVVDLGVLIEPRADGQGFSTFDGRVTVIEPGAVCQLCRRTISHKAMHDEGLKRESPERFRAYRRAGYLPVESGPSPAVVTFTTEVACMAVNEVIHRLTGFRGDRGDAAERIRRFDEVKEVDLVTDGRRREGCPLCDLRRYDGRGDCEPFLDQA